MKLIAYLALLQLSSGAPLRWPRDLPNYIGSVIQHYAQQKPGWFECVFYDLSAGTDDGLYDDLLASPWLDNIAKYVKDEKFLATLENFPVKPSITIVYMRDRNLLPPKCPMLVRHFFATLDSNSRVIVLVDTENFNAYQSIAIMMTHLKFDKVVFVGTTINLFIQLGYDGNPFRMMRGLPHPNDLIQSNLRHSNARPIGFTFRFMPWHDTHGWVAETARYLNTSLKYYPKLCTETTAVYECMDRLYKAMFIDVSLDQLAPAMYSIRNYRMIVGRQLNYQVILVPEGRLFNAIEMFTKPFSWKSWILLFLTLVSIEIVSVALPALFKNDPILLSLCGIEKFDLHLSSIKEKMTLLPMIIFFFLMCNAYETKLISFMTSKPSIGNIDTLEDLAKSGLMISADLNSDERLVNDTLLGPQMFHNNATEDYNRLDERYAHLSNNLEAPLLVAMLRNYDFRLGRPKFSIMKERKVTTIYAYWVGIISPFAEILYYTQKVFFEAGLLEKWKQDDVSQKLIADISDFRMMNTEPSGLLTFGDLISTWFLYAAGLVISLVVFLLEILMNCFKKKIRPRKRLNRHFLE